MGLREIISKTVSYPILGNLSTNIQEKLERNIKWYNGKTATLVSSFTNLILYGGIPMIYTSEGKGGWVILAAGAFGVIEATARTVLRERTHGFGDDVQLPRYDVVGASDYLPLEATHRPVGSLVGKIISWPIERGIASYDKFYKKKVVRG